MLDFFFFHGIDSYDILPNRDSDCETKFICSNVATVTRAMQYIFPYIKMMSKAKQSAHIFFSMWIVFFLLIFIAFIADEIERKYTQILLSYRLDLDSLFLAGIDGKNTILVLKTSHISTDSF